MRPSKQTSVALTVIRRTQKMNSQAKRNFIVSQVIEATDLENDSKLISAQHSIDAILGRKHSRKYSGSTDSGSESNDGSEVDLLENGESLSFQFKVFSKEMFRFFFFFLCLAGLY